MICTTQLLCIYRECMQLNGAMPYLDERVHGMIEEQHGSCNDGRRALDEVACTSCKQMHFWSLDCMRGQVARHSVQYASCTCAFNHCKLTLKNMVQAMACLIEWR